MVISIVMLVYQRVLPSCDTDAAQIYEDGKKVSQQLGVACEVWFKLRAKS